MADLDRLLKARADLREAEDALHEAVAAEFPEGAAVVWMHGRHRQSGIVDTTSNDRIFVTNDRTGNTVWISLYSVLIAKYDLEDIFS